MDYSDFDNVKREKASAMMKYHRLRKIANLFRLFEVLFGLLLISWFSTRLPSVFEISGEYLKKLCVLVVSPRFVFLVGNAIIITLFINSGQFSNKSTSKSPPSVTKEDNTLYDEFLKNSDNRHKIYKETSTEETLFQDKQTVSEQISSLPRDSQSPPLTPRRSIPRDSPPVTPRSLHRDSKSEIVLKKKSYRRSQSENVKREIEEKPQRELRRSETEKCWGVQDSVKDSAKDSEKDSRREKELSNEEFQRTIEAFIAKQAKFHWEESMAIVVKNQS